jgi:hypothetical protein
MPTDQTPASQVPNELDEAQLDKAAGGLLPAVKVYVCPSDPTSIGVVDPSTATFYLRNSNG